VIVVDTSIWVDHLRSADLRVAELVIERVLLQHPFVTGEIAAGSLHNRARTIRALRGLPQIEPVSEDELHVFMEDTSLHGTGLGFVDIHLLAATAMAGATVWTRDRRMLEQADRLGLTCDP
jgi:predicted nucleic acid-binding protein